MVSPPHLHYEHEKNLTRILIRGLRPCERPSMGDDKRIRSLT